MVSGNTQLTENSPSKQLAKVGALKIRTINYSRSIAPLALVLVTAILSWVNYTPGTWLSGWDTLHPEFNLSLYLKRIFWGVWQEHQGLGAVASQAHAAELPRLLIVYIFSLFFPPDFLRYAYFFTTLLVGPLGVHFFLNKILPGQTTSRKIASFCGALVYLLNLAVLQHYYVPFEMFATHFATLPWLFLFATKYLKKGKHKDLILFALITLLATSIAHTPTLFFVYFFGLVLYTGIFGLLRKTSREAFLIIVTTIIVNSFWLLPSLYFIKDHGEKVVNSKIHTMFSDKAFLTGQVFGTIQDTAIFKNFLFDWGEYNKDEGQFVDLFDEWKPYLGAGIIFVGYMVFSLAILGIAISTKSRNRYGLAFLPVFLASLLSITTALPGWEQAIFVLQQKIPLFKEALRFPFTKFSILLAFSFTVYTALAINKVLSTTRSQVLNRLVALGIPLLLILYILPAFQGNLISPSMRIKFPEEYFQTFKWFESQPSSRRIAHLPIHTFWGWVYYDWKYEGAGFLWFGLPQPLLDREFDRWSPYNEDYYWEMSYAIYSQNQELFERVLEKYQIHWLFVDKNVISPSSPESTYFDELERLIQPSTKISLAQSFGNIQIYKVNLESSPINFVFLAQNLPMVGPVYNWNNLDTAYLENSNYVSQLGDSSLVTRDSIYYPFRSLFTGREQKDIEFKIEDSANSFILKSKIPSQFKDYQVQVPKANNQDLLAFPQRAYIANGYLHIVVPKTDNDLAKKIDLALQTPPDCGKTRSRVVELAARHGSTCRISIPLETLPHNVSYLVTVKS
ncbi:MAG: hypothetical protein HY377_00725, partial [Candidatus Blackburnbacteria bacterium]|nr:hypothetical protein [Candidatus Blackburnbacteria bacterium]